MAEKTGNSETPSENSESLDNLLRSALEDFDSYSPPSKTTDVVCATSSDTAASAETSQSTNERLQEDFENKFKNLLLEDNIDDSTFSNQMSDLLSEVQKEIQSYVNDPNSPATDGNADTISQAINSMMQNMEQIKEGMKDELPDGLNMGDSFMEQMMQTLMSKEVLYPSLRNVKDKYPAWLEENESQIGSEELRRYTEQYKIIEQICTMFENENTSDSDEVKEKRFVELVNLLQKMTELGQPPQDLAESMPLGMENELLGSNFNPNSCNPM